ncbi:hypothetical protein ACLOJK_009123 [Asimina triloba]
MERLSCWNEIRGCKSQKLPKAVTRELISGIGGRDYLAVGKVAIYWEADRRSCSAAAFSTEKEKERRIADACFGRYDCYEAHRQRNPGKILVPCEGEADGQLDKRPAVSERDVHTPTRD